MFLSKFIKYYKTLRNLAQGLLILAGICLVCPTSYAQKVNSKNKLPNSEERANQIIGSFDDRPDKKFQKLRARHWQRLFNNFRSGHNFNFNLGIGRGTVEHSAIPDTSFVRDQYRLTAWSYRFSYAYHLRLYNQLGLMLGTSIGVSHANNISDSQFQPSVYVSYPGIYAGLVVNITTRVRFWSSIERNLERNENLKFSEGSESNQFKTSENQFTFAVGADYFFELNWAVQASINYKTGAMSQPIFEPNRPDDLNFDFDRTVIFATAGITYHLL